MEINTAGHLTNNNKLTAGVIYRPFVLLSLSSTKLNASGAKASPAFTNNDLFIRIVPELAFLACKRIQQLSFLVRTTLS